MPETNPENTPPSYDNEQARQFYRTATNPQRFPKKYWPGPEVEVDLFDAAVIQSYHDAVKRKRDEAREGWTPESKTDPNSVYLRELARISAATEYVQGVPIHEIHQEGLDNPQMQREGAFNYILQVAKAGAAEIKRLHATPKEAETAAPAESEAVLEILPKYVDLELYIIKLHREGRIKEAVDAQSLILLFELQKSSASPERQIRALYDIRTQLERKIVSWLFDHQPSHKADRDLALEKGVAYTSKIIGRPGARVLGMRPYQLIRKTAEETDNFADQLRVRDHVYSHIAYAIDKLYPL